MNRYTWLVLILLFFSSCRKQKATPMPPATDWQKLSYALGAELANNIKYFYPDVDPDWIARGARDVLENRPLLLTMREMRVARFAIEDEMMTRAARREQEERPEFFATANKNKQASDAFLQKNAARASVKTTPSGLQYEILRAGHGARPKATDEVEVYYKGMLPDGTVFDSTDTRTGQPAKFRVHHVIRGWAEALQLMQEGAKWRLYIPPELAYGLRGRSPHIKANMALVFEVELLKVIPNQYEYERSNYPRKKGK